MTDTAAKKLLQLLRPAYCYVGTQVKRAQFRREFRAFVSLSGSADTRFPVRWQDRMPCLLDRTAGTAFDRHYIYHAAWAGTATLLIRAARFFLWCRLASQESCSTPTAFIPTSKYQLFPAIGTRAVRAYS
jgi:hypothetical protein